MYSTVTSIDSDVKALLKDQEHVRSVMDAKKATGAAEWKIEFPEWDTRLSIKRDGKGYIGTVRWRQSTDRVVLNPIDEAVRNNGSGFGPRAVKLYSLLSSANTVVHRFDGIHVAEDGVCYAVMEDVTKAKTLGKSRRDPQFQPIAIRLRIIYDLAKTLAYLHSVSILVRCLSDRNVKLIERNRRWKPVLMDLEEGRLVGDGILERC